MDNTKRTLSIENQIKEFIKRPVEINIPTMGIYYFLDKNLVNDDIDTLIEVIDEIIPDFSIEKINSYYPSNSSFKWLFDDLITERTFEMIPPDDFRYRNSGNDTLREEWETRKIEYINQVLKTENFNEMKLRQTRNMLAEILNIEYELDQSSLMKDLKK